MDCWRRARAVAHLGLIFVKYVVGCLGPALLAANAVVADDRFAVGPLFERHHNVAGDGDAAIAVAALVAPFDGRRRLLPVGRQRGPRDDAVAIGAAIAWEIVGAGVGVDRRQLIRVGQGCLGEFGFPDEMEARHQADPPLSDFDIAHAQPEPTANEKCRPEQPGKARQPADRREKQPPQAKQQQRYRRSEPLRKNCELHRHVGIGIEALS